MEIERKFLVKNLPERLETYPALAIAQAYVSTDPVIRVRRSDGNFFLTVKGEGTIAREEYETALTAAQFAKLLAKAETETLEKTRYLIPLGGGLTAELDVYKNALSGLVTAEVEFVSLEAAEAFAPPDWFGEDVSADFRYRNVSLAVYGLPGGRE
ncbi:MAG: CYTH domain-containing protein [Firmicutes bacterium]|nr:CYTH domain-containing protein [Bacillota bacterium]